MALSGVYPLDEARITFEVADTSALFTPGITVQDNLGGFWTYVKASGTVLINDLVYMTGAAIPIAASATSTLLTTTASYMIGIAQIAAADTNFIWVWRGFGGGVGHGIKVNTSATATVNTKLYGNSSTAGAVSSSSVAPLIQGLQMAATVTGAGVGEVYASTLLHINCQD